MVLYKKQNGEIVSVDKSGIENSSDNDCLQKSNTEPYVPTGDYNPATKKYVDDIKEAIEVLLAAGGVHVGGSPPENASITWIDTSSGGIYKYYDETSEIWKPVKAVWG